MNLLTSSICFSFSFVMYIYLFGLKLDHSVKYENWLFIFPILLTVMGVYALFEHVKSKSV